MRLLTLHGQEITSHGRQMDRMHDDIGWLMTSMGEMYKYMGISVPPRPPPRVYPDQGPFFTQQPDPSMPSFTQPLPSMQPYDPSYTQPDLSLPHFPWSGQTMPLFPLSDLSMQAPGMSYTRHSPSPSTRRGRTLQRRSSLSLTRSLTSIDDDSGFYYHIM
ncbi:hypothetical protein HanPI659440_Chr03g0103601 [Helianthus annuus]|nr:hypothetical protein HanPI659440_Chr03g0103601 [Helianthus annuus]